MKWVWLGTSSALLALAVTGCVDEKIVYRDNPAFVTPPTAAAGFLGYADTTTGQTVCGNCHSGHQAKWEQTAHADAWATLQASGHASSTCEACHTISKLGNAETNDAVGYTSTKDSRYLNVQCESCHGPGLTHVTANARGQMLASIHVDTGAAITNGCAECHQGTHHPFTEEWRKSRHGRPNSHTFASATASPPDVPGAPRTSCRGCHAGQYVLTAWGVNTNYVEKDLATSIETTEGVTCVVCHDPHGSANDHQLRYAADSRDVESNLCAKCHQRRSVPDWAGSSDSPHSPQGPLVLGEAGWFPEGVNFEAPMSTHGSEANPGLCKTCHLTGYSVTDAETGAFQITVTGHRFIAIPCVDANGAPTDDQSCTVTGRSFKGCASASCHGNSETNARNAFVAANSDVLGLAALLDQMVAQVPSNQFGSGKTTAGRGAKFNSSLAKSPGSAVHNPFLIKALLRYSGVALNQAYGIAIPAGLAPTAADLQYLRFSR